MSSGNRTVTGAKKPSSVLKVKVGNVSDFPNIDQAREAARQLIQTMISPPKEIPIKSRES